jgi:YfiH family protein
MMLQAGNLAGIRHAFFTREGGVSEGVYASLNAGVGSGDDPAKVAENRARMARAVGVTPERFLTAYQIHSPDVVVAEMPWRPDARPRADAIVTRVPGLAIGVSTADCGPVLFADPRARVIGAAHAGWRGALSGVIEAAVRAMAELGAWPERISAAVGPCIAQPSYEVGPELRAQFVAEDPRSASLFEPVAGSDRLLLDLKGYALLRLARSGIEDRIALPDDTFAEEERFFSARRTRLNGGERFGLLLSAIALAD